MLSPVPARNSATRISRARAAERTAPRLIATIDLGSRALRLAVGEFRQGSEIRRLETLATPISLGLDTFTRGRIRAVTIEAVLRTLKDFLTIIKGYGLRPEDCWVVATTAVRRARNREVFLERVRHGSGLSVHVLEAIEETRLVHQLTRHVIGPRFDHGSTMVLALGAGSLQLVAQEQGEISMAETQPFGLLRLMQRTDGMAPGVALGATRTFLDRVVASMRRVHNVGALDNIVVINSELYELVERLGRVTRSHGVMKLSRSAFARLGALVREASVDRLVDQAGLEQSAATVARIGVEVLDAFSAITPSVRQYLFPRTSMLDSLLLDLRLNAEEDGQRTDQHAPVESAAWAIARKYHVDEEHTENVRKLALQLYDELQVHTTLAGRSRLLLAVAAILHDIGLYVGSEGFERHSEYLVRAAQIVGLSSGEVERVALLARFHRNAAPPPDSPALKHLTPTERVELLKLAAILRVAEGLDADNLQRVDRVTAKITDDAIEFRAQTRSGGRDAFAELQRTFEERSDLCRELFGVEPRLREVLAT